MKLIDANKIEHCECGPAAIEDAVASKEAMVKLMIEKKGYALSAPQVGIFKRFFVMRNFRGKDPILVINPKLEISNPKKGTFEEGCLSYPGEFFRVKRYKQIRASWTSESGKKVYTKLTGKECQIFQHEFDHLEGITVKIKSRIDNK